MSILGGIFTALGVVAAGCLLIKFGIWIGKNYVRLKKYINQYTTEE